MKQNLINAFWMLHYRLRLPFWCVGHCWSDCPVFKLTWLGFWTVAYDASLGHAYYQHWPHIKIMFNRED